MTSEINISEFDDLLNEVFYGKADSVADVVGALPQSFSMNDAFENFYADIIKILRNKKCALKNIAKDQSKSSFFNAVKHGHAEIVKDLLQCKALINKQFRSKIERSIRDYKKTVELIVESGAEVRSKDKVNFELYHNAITNGYINIVRDFLDAGVDVNAHYVSRFDNYLTALHRATQSRQHEIVKLLLKSDADIEAFNEYDKTPLFYAIRNADYQMCLILLENGASTDDCEILHYAIMRRSKNIIKLLLNFSAEINVRDEFGRAALHFISISNPEKCSKRFVYSDPRRDITLLLLDHGADIEATTRFGITPLHAAALKGYPHIAEVLLQHNARVDVPIFGNKTALFFACYNSFGKMVEVLLRYGADINCIDETGKSALDVSYTGGGIRYAMIFERPYEVDVVKRYGNSLQNCRFDSDYSDYDHYDYSFNQHYRQKTSTIIEKHIIKLLTIGVYVCREVMESFTNIGNYVEFRKQCEAEVKTMRGVFVINNITVYDLVKKSLNQLARCTGNLITLEALETYNYAVAFPLYDNVIRGRIRQSIERGRLLTAGYETLHSLLNSSQSLPTLPIICVEKIIKYMDNLNIRNFANVFSNYKDQNDLE